ncbi:4-coumarate--CoA ligase 1-like isoform X2 [Varroa jacobsoni]|uniref:4-coumarate--CoA ligase 1-like isoform X2 n=1 Tax=Varroa jacobsoni TaxID=62625 RepID=UPI000BF85F98|nr:4-coumarate--CoA ligase 1-like isoform X2 [Varroa jacobsoni]
MMNLFCFCGAKENVIEMPVDKMALDDVDTFCLGDGSLCDHYRARWTYYGDKTALVDHVTGDLLTYSELLETVSQLAGALSAIGVTARQRVALHADNSMQSVLALLALEFLNATTVACKTSFTVREMVYQCTAADVEFIITDKACYNVVLQSLDQLPMKVVVANMGSPATDLRIAATMEDLLKRRACFRVPDDVDPSEDEVLIVFTSGTTGLPKGVLHTHSGFIAQFRITGPSGSNVIRSTDVCFQWGPLSHISGNLSLQLALNVGATSIIGDVKRDLRDCVRICDTHRVTFLIAMPVVLKAMIDLLKINPGGCSTLKTVLVGGGVVSVSWSKEFLSLLNLDCYRIVFGMSESLLVCATPDQEKWITSIGLPMPGVEMKIVDSEGNALSPNEKGEIAIRAPCNMKGYDKNPEATSETIVNGWLMTGDCGYVDEQGVYFILERIKQMIKCMDNQLAPAELEDFLISSHESIKEVAIIGLPDDKVGEAPAAYVVLKDEVEPSDELRKQIADMVKEEFSVYKHLYGGVFFAKELPKTDSGKFAKTDLKKLILEGNMEIF